MRFERRQWWIIAAAGLVFALVFGVRQSQALFISPLNSATGLGIASISLAFAVAQLMWGITQPFAGAVADRYGSGRVIALGGVLVMLGTVLTPHAHSTWMLILLIGVVAGGRAARLAAARQARGRAGRAARDAGKIDAGRGARRDARPELRLPHHRILRLRLPRRLHRHAPTRRRRLLPAAA